MKNEVKCQIVALVVGGVFFEDERDTLIAIFPETPIDPFATNAPALTG